jgi:flavodoxin
MNKRWLVLGLVAVLVVLGLLGVRFYLDQMTWTDSVPYARRSADDADTLVVHYSRTGNSASAAHAAAASLDADTLRIDAPQYGLTVAGNVLAVEHAEAQLRLTPIEYTPVELSAYTTVVLVSPTWLFRPAVPMWAFVEGQDFHGANVVLVMTGNSRLKTEHVDEFGALVVERGGVFVGNHFIKRGRFWWQKSTDVVDAEIVEALAALR